MQFFTHEFSLKVRIHMRTNEKIRLVDPMDYFMQVASDSPFMSPAHISLFVALYQMWKGSGSPLSFEISTAEVMRTAKISGKATYYKCLHELISAGCINYRPEHYPGKRSKISIVPLRISPLKT